MSQISKETVEVTTVTPRYAKELLAKNFNNRTIRNRWVEEYASAMTRGEWEFNGDSIRIDRNGVVLDGQHRLSAVIASGVPMKTLLVTGLEPKVFDTIDTGKKRTAGDALSMRGETNANGLAAVARMYFTYMQSGNPCKTVITPTVPQVEETIDENPGIRNATDRVTKSKWCKRYLTVRIGGFCYYVFRQHDFAAATEDFFNGLETGAELVEGSPIMLLRDRLMEDRISRDRLAEEYKVALIFKAFRHARDGQTLRNLRIRMHGPKAEYDWFRL